MHARVPGRGVVVAIRRLLENAELGLRLCSEVPPERLERRVAWVVSNELIDPTPYLSGGELLLLTGMGLNIRDERSWDAYVERLVDAGVAAVALHTGIAHPAVPRALRDCATGRGLPLLEVPQHVPAHALQRFVAEVLRQDRSHGQDAAWRVAAQLAHAAAAGAELDQLLRVLAEAIGIGCEAAVLDGNGELLAASGTGPRAPGAARAREGEQPLLLPITGLPSHALVVTDAGRHRFGAEQLEPVVAVLSLYLERSLAEPRRSVSWLAGLEEQLAGWESPAAAIARSLAEAGLPLPAPLSLALARVEPGGPYEAYTVRLLLSDLFGTVRVAARAGHVFALLCDARSGPTEDGAAAAVHEAVALFRARRPALPIVFTAPCTDAEQLRAAYLTARALLPRLDGPARARSLDLLGVVGSAAPPGAQSAAVRFLQPLVDHDARFGSGLLPTLRAYIAHDGRPGMTAAALHVHRNTLGYRLDQIETKLGVSLSSVAGLASCLLALQLADGAGPPD